MIQIITALLPLLDKILPDEKAKDAAKLEALKLAQEGQLAELDAQVKLMLGQIEVNKVEAAHQSIFVSGARPFIVWVCGFGMAYAAILHPLFAWIALMNGAPTPPQLDSDVLMYVLGGILGLGGYRTFEKTKGVASK
jgi:hypothetical protein